MSATDSALRLAYRHLEIPRKNGMNGYLRHPGLNQKIDYPLEFPGGRHTPAHMLADILTDPNNVSGGVADGRPGARTFPRL